MTGLRDRLRASDPARDMRALDDAEQTTIRRAMRDAPEARRSLAWKLAGSLALATACAAAIASLLWPPVETPPSLPLAVLPGPVLPAPDLSEAPVVANVPPRRPAPPRFVAPRPPTVSTTREVRFVTASGTQIVWTFRTSEEGA